MLATLIILQLLVVVLKAVVKISHVLFLASCVHSFTETAPEALTPTFPSHTAAMSAGVVTGGHRPDFTIF